MEGDRSSCTWFKGSYIRFSNYNWNMGGGQMDMNYATTTGAKSSITAAFTAGALAAAATQF